MKPRSCSMTLAGFGPVVLVLAFGCDSGPPPLPAPSAAPPPSKEVTKTPKKRGVSRFAEEDSSFHLRKGKK